MEKIMEKDLLIRDVETKNIMTKSSLPVGGYSVNPYVGCTHGCKYCYANFKPETVKENLKNYDPKSPLLCGVISEKDKITERKVKSLKEEQICLFES